MKKLSILIVLVAIALSACGAPAPTSVAAPPTVIPPTAVPPTPVPPTAIPPTATLEPCGEADQLIFESINNSSEEINFFWLNFDNKEEDMGAVESGGRFSACAYVTHKLIARNAEGKFVMEYTVTADAVQRSDITQEMADNAGADPLEEGMKAALQKFKTDGRIDATEGELIRLNDYSIETNELTYYTLGDTGMDITGNFVYSGRFKWSTAASSNKASGCGVIFGSQQSGSHYALFLDQHQIYFLRSDASSGTSRSWILGKAAGTGKVDFENPAEADFNLIVNGTHTYVYVNGEFIGQYDLLKDGPTQGKFGYSIISNVAKDYGTRCEIANGAIWALK